MAKINLARRAEIGQEKRARTRAQLVAAARALFSVKPWASVTIDDLVREAGVAKGTYYAHFDDMHALTAAVGDELIRAFDELIQPRRAAATPSSKRRFRTRPGDRSWREWRATTRRSARRPARACAKT